jgi:urease accessory protein
MTRAHDKLTRLSKPISRITRSQVTGLIDELGAEGKPASVWLRLARLDSASFNFSILRPFGCTVRPIASRKEDHQTGHIVRCRDRTHHVLPTPSVIRPCRLRRVSVIVPGLEFCSPAVASEELLLPRVGSIIGTTDDPELRERVHQLSHAGRVEYITLTQGDMARHRLRATSDKGTEYAILLPRDQPLRNGAILRLDEEGALVVRLEEQHWLTVAPVDIAAALQLGYHAGNMHWRVRFDGGRLKIALEGDETAYLARLAPLIDNKRVQKIDGH